MKVYKGGGHHHTYIDEWKDFPDFILKEKPLIANLQDLDSGKDLGKLFVLKYDPYAKNPDVSFVPEESSWDDLKEMHVTITLNIQGELKINRYYIFRFGSASSIDLYLEEDISGLI